VKYDALGIDAQPERGEANATEIISGLWQGDQLSGVLAANAGFDVVVDLTPPTASTRVHGPGMLYVHWPIEDTLTLPDSALLRAVSDLCVGALEARKKVLVHCGEGQNRSGLICALVVRSVRQCSGREAMDIVRIRRPRAVQNSWFAAYLNGLP
jgi:protein-tyrosine phosphatase